MKKVNILLLLLLALQCSDKPTKIITVIDPIQIKSSETVRNGIDVLIEDYPDFLHGKAVGLVTNHTGITRREKKIMRYSKKTPTSPSKKSLHLSMDFLVKLVLVQKLITIALMKLERK